MLESRIQRKIMKYLKEQNCFAFKVSLASINGVPDIFFIAPNSTCVFIEVKQAKGKVSPLQEYQIKRINSYDPIKVQAHVVYSFEEFIEIYNNLNLI